MALTLSLKYPELASIITIIDSRIHNFCKVHSRYKIFRFGSSLYSDRLPIADLDFILVDILSEVDFSNEINKLKDELLSRDFMESGFHINDKIKKKRSPPETSL